MRNKRSFKTVVRNCIATAFAVGALAFCWNGNVLISQASAGEIIKATANIRQEPSTSSAAVGSVLKGDKVDIQSKTTASDGSVWYKIAVNANGVDFGYIRSDLLNITDGTTPPDEAAPAPGSTAPAATGSVEALNPVSATVINADSVRVRDAASTQGQIVTTVAKDMTVTVTGRATAADGKVWYQVSFLDNGNTVNGFIRSDYASVQGDLTPSTGVTDAAEPTADQPAGETPSSDDSGLPVVAKHYETKENPDLAEDDEKRWVLIDNVSNSSVSIKKLLTSYEQNKDYFERLLNDQKSLKKQKLWIIILLILIVALIGVVIFLIYKLRDVKDSAYFAAVEKETIRRKGENRQGSGKLPAKSGDGSRPKNVMTDLDEKPARQGAQKPAAQGGQRPAQGGQRPAQGAQRPAQGGQRPVQGGQRSVQGGQRPAQGGQRPVQGGQRPAQEGQRPVQGGQRPAQGQPTRTVSPDRAQARPAQPTRTRVADNSRLDDEFDGAPVRPAENKPKSNSAWKAKNFIQDDEFEYEFLNNDSDDDIL